MTLDGDVGGTVRVAVLGVVGGDDNVVFGAELVDGFHDRGMLLVAG